MKNILKGKSFKEMKDETIEKVEDFIDDHGTALECAAFMATTVVSVGAMFVVFDAGVKCGTNNLINAIKELSKESF